MSIGAFALLAPFQYKSGNSAPMVASGATTIGPSTKWSSFILEAGNYSYFTIEPKKTLLHDTWLISWTKSSVPIETAILNSSQFASFTASYRIINAVSYQYGTSNENTSLLEKGGVYTLVVYSPSATALVSLTFQLYPFGEMTPPQPTGIASFGLNSTADTVRPYVVEAQEVVGVANVSSILAHNATAYESGSDEDGASLQLNAALLVTDTDGTQQTYWCQDVLFFYTAPPLPQVEFDSNVWNYTSHPSQLNSTSIYGDGTVNPLQRGFEKGGEYYGGGTFQNSSYALPFNVALVMNETVTKSQSVIVQMGDQVAANGSVPASAEWIPVDKITIPDAQVQNATFYVSGLEMPFKPSLSSSPANQTQPYGYYYDAELVFGGPSGGASTNFTSLKASLGLFHSEPNSTTLVTFPSYYDFGLDTAEAADNLHVTYTNNEFASISSGSPNYAYLGAGSESSSISSSVSSTQSSVSLLWTQIGTFLEVAVVLVIVFFSITLLLRRRQRSSTGSGRAPSHTILIQRA